MNPDFTGEWTLLKAESDFAFLGAPRERVDAIEHRDTRLRILTRQRDTNGEVAVVRDLAIGGEAVEVLIHGKPRKIHAYWDAAGLVVETASEVSGHSRRILDRWTLDDDAERLVIERRHEQPGGSVTQRLVFNRCA